MKDIVEEAYNNNLISILCRTTSQYNGQKLASNVVIIKNTFRFINSKSVQYSETDINQMIGRVGIGKSSSNPNTKAVAIILTKSCHKKRYEEFPDKNPLKSCLKNSLCEFINTEIILGHLKSFNDVVDYLKLTYFYIYLQIAPESYNLPKNANFNEEIKKLANEILTHLKSHKVIISGDKQFESIEKAPLGLIMSENCVTFNSIRTFININTDQSINSLLSLLCQCKELIDQANIRRDEKGVLSELNKGNNLKFPIRNKTTYKITDSSQKANCLIQARLGGLLDSPNQQILIQEAIRYQKTAGSLAKVLVECLDLQSEKSFGTFKNAILLSKSLHAGKFFEFFIRQIID